MLPSGIYFHFYRTVFIETAITKLLWTRQWWHNKTKTHLTITKFSPSPKIFFQGSLWSIIFHSSERSCQKKIYQSVTPKTLIQNIPLFPGSQNLEYLFNFQTHKKKCLGQRADDTVNFHYHKTWERLASSRRISIQVWMDPQAITLFFLPCHIFSKFAGKQDISDLKIMILETSCYNEIESELKALSI